MAKKKRVKKVVSAIPQPTADADTTADGAPPAKRGPMPASRLDRNIAIGIAAICLVVYLKTVVYQFITIDDGAYVFDNQAVGGGLSWEGIKFAFTSITQANWQPLTCLSYMLDSTIFGMGPSGFHLVNILIHTVNSVFLFYLLRRLTSATWRSAVVAAIFAVHPTHIETVAWVAERNYLLCTFFWLLSTYFYVRYVRQGGNTPEDRRQRRRLYLFVAGAMVLGGMSKPVIVALPFTLLLLDYWPLERIKSFKLGGVRPLVVEKLPLFALSIASSILTVFAQKGAGAVVALGALPFPTRALNALLSYAKYVLMLFYPVGLGFTYPYNLELSPIEIIGSAALLLGITAYCIYTIKTRKYLIVGWLWFVGTLVPVIGIVQVGAQSLADRYTYIPYIGLSIMAVWLVNDLLKPAGSRIAAGLGVAAVVLCGVLTFQQLQYWQNSEALYLRTISVTTKNGFMEQSLCLLYMNGKRTSDAEAHCRKAIEYFPNYATPYKLLGTMAFEQNKADEAARYFETAIQLKPNDYKTYSDLAVSHVVGGRFEQAEEVTGRLASMATSDPAALEILLDNYYVMGTAYFQRSEWDRAAGYFKKGLAINNADSGLRMNYGLSLYRAGQKQDGTAQIRESIRQQPDSPEAYNTLGTVLSAEGDREGAIAMFKKALDIKPDFQSARNNLDKLQQR